MKAEKVEYNLDEIILDDDLGPVDQPIPRPKPYDMAAIKARQDLERKELLPPSSYEEILARSRDNLTSAKVGSSVFFDIHNCHHLHEDEKIVVQRHAFPIAWQNKQFIERRYPIGFTNANWSGEPLLLFYCDGTTYIEHNAPAARGKVHRGISVTAKDQAVLVMTDLSTLQRIDPEEELFWPIGPQWIIERLLGNELISDLQIKHQPLAPYDLVRVEIEDDDSSGVNLKKFKEYPIGSVLSEQVHEYFESVVPTATRMSFCLIEDIECFLESREYFTLVLVIKTPDEEYEYHILEPYNPKAVMMEIESYSSGDYGDVVAITMVVEGKLRSWDAEYLLSNILELSLVVFVPSFPKTGESDVCGIPLLGIDPNIEDAYTYSIDATSAHGILVAEVRDTLRGVEYAKRTVLHKPPKHIPTMEVRIFTLGHKTLGESPHVEHRIDE